MTEPWEDWQGVAVREGMWDFENSPFFDWKPQGNAPPGAVFSIGIFQWTDRVGEGFNRSPAKYWVEGQQADPERAWDVAIFCCAELNSGKDWPAKTKTISAEKYLEENRG